MPAQLLEPFKLFKRHFLNSRDKGPFCVPRSLRPRVPVAPDRPWGPPHPWRDGGLQAGPGSRSYSQFSWAQTGSPGALGACACLWVFFSTFLSACFRSLMSCFSSVIGLGLFLPLQVADCQVLPDPREPGALGEQTPG